MPLLRGFARAVRPERGCIINTQFKRVLVSAFIAAFSGTATADFAALVESCDGCHGVDGVSQWPDMPTIAGIDEFVHSEALFIYRDEARPCADSEYRLGDTSRRSTNMCDLSRDLSDEQIEALAAHYAALDFVPAAQEFDADLAAAGVAVHDSGCAICHSDGGANPADESSILAGQWMGYLRATFEHYKAGERDQPPRMQKAIDALSDDDVEALLHFYASQQ